MISTPRLIAFRGLLVAVAIAVAACGAVAGGGDAVPEARTPVATPAAAETAVAEITTPSGPDRESATPSPDASADLQPAVATVEGSTSEFEAWRRDRAQRAVRNLRALFASRLGSNADGAIVGAGELPAAFANAAFCATAPPRLAIGSLHPLPQLLPWLGFAVGDLSTGSEATLRRWVWQTSYLSGLNSIRADFGLDGLGLGDLERGAEAWSGVPAAALPAFTSRLAALEPALTAPGLFTQALEIERGDVYRALLTAHNFLRESRSDARVQAALVPIREDGGDDSGAYYHLFGMAAYALAFELATNAAGALGAELSGPNPLPPEAAALVEEIVVSDPSGDMTGDPTELAVDLLGARVGRHLYEAFADQAAAPQNIDCSPAGPPAQTVPDPSPRSG